MNAGVIEALFNTRELADLGPRGRDGVWSREEAERRAAEAAGALGLAGGASDCLRALVLVWHDHPDGAHGLVQDLAGGDAAWVHGIIHRREPDYSNARYWFHRVGSHGLLERLAEGAAPMLAGHASLPYRLIRDGEWDPMAFIDAVALVARPGGGEKEAIGLLRALQGLEIRMLAAHVTGADCNRP
ncbi:MAG: hypothetical protein KF833_10650 [Verrucomicrobiae bacterium]|nr:hypothetical protein [Verrucomicrobiae bacterium]